ncbi:MAG: hypothetical protein PHT60_05940 [Acidiphilium sp.]|nr:hypothetical protein [Acidiphilium sp.]MDD4935304.1 hypothetical protein [Acidiphilium sp.]
MTTPRLNSPEWQVLRRDKATFVATLAVYLESLCVVVALSMLTDHSAVFPQGAPVFWVLGVPLTVWALWMGSYGAAAVMVFRVLMVADPIVAAGALIVAVRVGAAGIGLFGATVGVTIILGAVGWLAYRRSALRRMGPMQG